MFLASIRLPCFIKDFTFSKSISLNSFHSVMIINKSAYERGFAHGCIYHSDFVELTGDSYFVRDHNKESLAQFLDTDGLPHPGQKIFPGDPMCW